MDHETYPKKKDDLSIPLAIIFAGVLVAGAIIFSGNASPSVSPTTEVVVYETPQFDACLSSGKYADHVQKDFENGVNIGVEGTPYTIIWNRKTRKQVPVNGARSFTDVAGAIDIVLASKVSPTGDETDAPIAELELRSDDHVRGNQDADVLIIEYSDAECPFCKKFHETMLQVMDKYEKNGKVAWVYRHFPLDQIHPKARKEAEAMECAGEQGGSDAFWKYANKLFEITPSNNGLDPAQLPLIAGMIGLK